MFRPVGVSLKLTAMTISLTPVWSWLFVTAAALALLVAVAWTYPRRLEGIAPFWRRLLFGLRLAIVLLTLSAMSRPAIVFG